ncbi:hypothetical protein [Algoriphagus taiwanensis]|uniref:Holin n=1 Tax=Algoriphagus taiwanensis TaxID=1445656 RepID=A0ABQ6Q7L1_9BACT|nr:hypothetical protein Ataiwa_37860 [Algoriphagus taiwanensis]
MDLINEIRERVQAPTPPFFQILRKLGLWIAAAGLAVMTAPGTVPEIIQEVAGYAITAGTILVSICQLTVDESKLEERILSKVK